MIRSGRYGHVPREKPDDTVRLMVENWNSLGVFTGQSKIHCVDSMLKDFGVDILAGSETQCDWRQADSES